MSLELVYYGDDFTGSTDVLETLALAGVPAVLFLERPDAAALAQFAGCRAIGLAGESRSRTPEWMDEQLPGIFAWMKSLGARKAHYKVCSTFDSSPGTGSIGRAIEIGQRVFGTRWTPVLAAAPALRRYVAFGNLFAAAGAATYRIDRHPVMSRHPVTPMGESDLRRHLAEQTAKTIALLELPALMSGAAAPEAEIVVLDAVDEASMRAAGRVLEEGPEFVVGSSGVEQALLAWQGRGRGEAPAGAEADRLVVMSGSCSATTAAQIEWALASGYAGVALTEAVDPVGEACRALAEGRSVVLYSARAGSERKDLDEAGRAGLARRSGAMLDAVLRRSGVRRAVIAGGDTASHAAPQLGVWGLEFVAPLAPGAPLCRAFAGGAHDGLELVFKGGQVGGEGFFEQARRGRP